MAKNPALLVNLLVCVALAGTCRADITSNLEVWLKFDDGTGTAATDSSGNGRNGTLTNGPTWGTGQVNGCVVLDGSNDRVTFVAAPVGSATTFTIGCWVRTTSLANTQAVYGETEAGGNVRHFCQLSTSGNLAYDNFAPSGGSISSSGTVSTNTWTHLCWVRNGATLTFYKNGSSSGSGSPDTFSGTTPTEFAVGFRNAQPFVGSIDEFRVYSRALSGSDVTELYNYSGAAGANNAARIYYELLQNE